MADDTPLKGVVGTAANHGEETTVLNPQQVGVEEDFTLMEKYQREILRHAEDWLEACMVQVDRKQKEHQELERRYFHCNTKTARLRKRARNADSWNLEFVSQKIQPHLEKSEAELAMLIQEHKDKANEVCFLLDEVTAHGWKDLYPLVESSMEWEVDRFHHDEDTNGQVLPVALEKLQASFRMLQEEELNRPRSVHGMAQIEEEQGGGVEETKSETQETPQFKIDPSKPTLFLDDADPFTARVWITLLEKEADPLHPTGFHVIPVCNINSEDPGLQLLNSINQTTSPVLVHNGNIFADSIRVSEYIDKAIRHPLYHSIPSLLPSRPIDTFNMKTFLKRHARISDVFYNLMDSDDDDARPQLAQELFDLLGMIDKDLQKFPGPYLCGSQFTLADVSIFPFVEHINIILASFGGTSIPESLSSLLEWYEVVSRRPSVQMVTADPLNTVRTNDQGKKRVEYLIEYHQQRCDFVADA
jgi:glutathione S-transferase